MVDSVSLWWLRVTDVSGVVVFDCVHNGGTWEWEWARHEIVDFEHDGSCESVEDLCNVARRVQVSNGGSVVSGALSAEFNSFWN